MQYPATVHMDAPHHVLRYLRGTHDKSIRYSRDTRDHVDRNTLWQWFDAATQIRLEIQPLDALAQVTC